MFEALRERDYRRFWSTQFISNIGSWMQGIAQGWLVYRLTDSPFLLGFVGFANSLPMFFLMLPGGVLADQLDRRKVLRTSQWAQALCAGALALSIYNQTITVWQIIAAAIVVGIAQSFSAPAYQAMVVDLLEDRTRLPNAVAMNSLQFNLSRAIGPLLAGAALAAYGPFWCFLLNALSFLPLIYVLGLISHRQQKSDPGALWTRLTEGLRFVRNDRLLVTLMAVISAVSLFGYPFLTLMPVLAREVFVNDATGLGILTGAVGVGAFAGALRLSVRTPDPHHARSIIIGGVILFGIALAGTALSRNPWLVVPFLVICGVTMVVTLVLCNTLIQQRIPDTMRGRVLSIYTFSFFAFIPFGNLLAGLLAEREGITSALLLLGGGVLASGLLAGIAVPRYEPALDEA